MRALALDVGSKTIGLAVSDEAGVMALAREVLSRKGHKLDAAAVLEQVDALQARAIVLGLPLELDGSEGHRARLVRRFLTVLEAQIGDAGRDLPVYTWDERFSTAAAERTMLEADVSRAKRKRRIDALAAQFILQGWLDAQLRAREQNPDPNPDRDLP